MKTSSYIPKFSSIHLRTLLVDSASVWTFFRSCEAWIGRTSCFPIFLCNQCWADWMLPKGWDCILFPNIQWKRIRYFVLWHNITVPFIPNIFWDVHHRKFDVSDYDLLLPLYFCLWYIKHNDRRYTKSSYNDFFFFTILN